MKLLKLIVLLPALMLITACATVPDSDNIRHKAPTQKTKTKHKTARKAFDVLGGSEGENELDLDKFAKGDIVIEDEKQAKSSKKHFDTDFVQEGVASWYGPRFHGRRTANGSVYNQHEYSAAHRTLLMPSVVRVVNLENQRSVLVVINDRGPYVGKSHNRIIDLSRKAAQDLGMLNKGTARVRVEYLHDQTLALLSKFPDSKKVVASAKLSKALIRHVTHLNVKNGARL
jgi:rare lipoprotein A (peptidoglycan hydrolase)